MDRLSNIIPNIKYSMKIPISNVKRLKLKSDRKFFKSFGRPAKFIKLEKIMAPNSKKNNIVVTFAVSIRVSEKDFIEIFFFNNYN